MLYIISKNARQNHGSFQGAIKGNHISDQVILVPSSQQYTSNL